MKKPTFEKNLNDLIDIVEKLEENTLPLEESLSLYKKGLKLSSLCNETLNSVESEVMIMQKDSQAVFNPSPFDAP